MKFLAYLFCFAQFLLPVVCHAQTTSDAPSGGGSTCKWEPHYALNQYSPPNLPPNLASDLAGAVTGAKITSALNKGYVLNTIVNTIKGAINGAGKVAIPTPQGFKIQDHATYCPDDYTWERPSADVFLDSSGGSDPKTPGNIFSVGGSGGDTGVEFKASASISLEYKVVSSDTHFSDGSDKLVAQPGSDGVSSCSITAPVQLIATLHVEIEATVFNNGVAFVFEATNTYNVPDHTGTVKSTDQEQPFQSGSH